MQHKPNQMHELLTPQSELSHSQFYEIEQIQTLPKKSKNISSDDPSQLLIQSKSTTKNDQNRILQIPEEDPPNNCLSKSFSITGRH